MVTPLENRSVCVPVGRRALSQRLKTPSKNLWNIYGSWVIMLRIAPRFQKLPKWRLRFIKILGLILEFCIKVRITLAMMCAEREKKACMKCWSRRIWRLWRRVIIKPLLLLTPILITLSKTNTLLRMRSRFCIIASCWRSWLTLANWNSARNWGIKSHSMILAIWGVITVFTMLRVRWLKPRDASWSKCLVTVTALSAVGRAVVAFGWKKVKWRSVRVNLVSMRRLR